MLRKLPVKEIMSRKPVVVKHNSLVSRAAKLMKKNNVGSLIVIDKKNPVGIVTERDILLKVIAKDISPRDIKVKDIMSSPVVSINPNTDINDAAKKMAKLRIRRLLVVEKNKLAGLITESDILKIAPDLLEVTREYAKINSSVGPIKKTSGFCEICMAYSDELMLSQGQLLCSWCAEGR